MPVPRFHAAVRAAVALFLVAPFAFAQSLELPRLRASEWTPITTQQGPVIRTALDGRPGSAYAILLDIDGGPFDVLGERVWLGLTPAASVLHRGVLPPWGNVGLQREFPGATGLEGTAFYLQGFVLDPASPNGVFEGTNPESTFVSMVRPIVDRFDDPAAAGFAGDFDRSVSGRLQGAAVSRRLVSTVDPVFGVPFARGIQTPLNPFGARLQIAFRPADVGANGNPELLTAVRWRLFGRDLQADRFGRLVLKVGHTDVTPDYSIDPFSSLPRFPMSGLDPVFANNERRNDPPQSIYDGPYVVRPTDLRSDGYVDYPVQQPFAYNGQDSLLLDVQLPPSQGAAGQNGQVVRLMSQTSPFPFARVVARGRAAQPIDGTRAVSGDGDSALPDYQLEFTRVESVAVSPWKGPLGPRNFRTPVIAKSEPRGTSVEFEYRGADDRDGAGATAWSSNISIANGKVYLQYRITFRANPVTNEVPSVDSFWVSAL